MRPGFTPSSVSIRSSAASPPQTLPFHSTTSEFEAFKREVDRKACDVNLHRNSVPKADKTDRGRGTSRPEPRRTTSKQDPPPIPSTNPPINAALERANSIGKLDQEPIPRSPKRQFPDDDTANMFDQPSRGSSTSLFKDSFARTGSPPPKHEDKKVPRLSGSSPSPSISQQELVSPLPLKSALHQRAETLPEKFEPENPSMVTAQYVINVLESSPEEILILDLRVVTQYEQSRITGALNLCVPTTLLKRSSYNVERLAETFKDARQRAKFEQWRSSKSIVVYDTNTSQIKEALNCTYILKKFLAEGWQGGSFIIRGGFAEFGSKFPQFVERGQVGTREPSAPSLPLKVDADSSIPPVIGGCPMPVTESAANPFFGNIRQNMDLIGGVGQMKLHLPASSGEKFRQKLPLWLDRAADAKDEGKTVADKFLQIEKREQKRMQEALSGNVTYGTPGPTTERKIEIAGIEKGSKNRYNNIWPFEHSRVKLEGVPSEGCDYVNANFVSTTLSEKSYIATQGPIPATFNDFWNMVWQRDVRVVVMLTAEQEGGQIKAHNYWNQRHYGPFKLSFLSERRVSLELNKSKKHKPRPSLVRNSSSQAGSASARHSKQSDNASSKKADSPAPEQPYVIVRNFTLAHEGEPFSRMREITQLQYSSWPDFGAPAHPAHLLGLVEQCDKVVRATSGSQSSQSPRPVLVHCSAGCGRTGTFCTVDSVLDMLAKQRQKQASVNGTPKATEQDRYASPMDVGNSHLAGNDPFFSSGSYLKAEHAETPMADSTKDWLVREDMDLIERTVEEFRLQRLSMVQSLRQFVLCYETVLEWLANQEERD